MHLTNEDENHRSMCHKTILDALVVGATLNGDEYGDMQESAIVAMERLATDFSNRPIMARHPGLLTAVAKATERETRQVDKGVDPKSEHLAKPLLMSLLLAM
eukprot:CAMPEP_0116553084 /NCGR_PEP_ID=MMETSP0397-20121206/6855_1 /TAXON_ID=216820 /ORGANISM="Cyclophora tenuis, Strain ECT3854" /LENGTH=101 /DNA_ID=CAMNT_0004078125 /DNA_START=138 /DNA_END=443 /DNA_ORIENTATION=+